MKPFSLTLVTITKDDPPGLERTLASAAALRDAGAEHLVIDGSTKCSEIGLDTSRVHGVRVLHRPPDGIADALNAGITAAQGEWVWCLNGGDRVDARMSPQMLGAFLDTTRADIVIGGTTYEGEDEPRPHPPSHLRWPPFRSWIPHPSTLVRRRLFAQFGQFDGNYTIAMDYEWWMRVIPTGVAVDVLNVPLAVFAPGGVSQRPETLATVRREQYSALRKHQASLAFSWAALSGRWWKAWFVAQFARRLSKHARGNDA